MPANMPPTISANKSPSSSVIPVVQPVARKRGRPCKIDTQSVVEDHDNLSTIVARHRHIRHTPCTGNVCDLGSRPLHVAERSDSLLDTINRVDDLRKLPADRHGNVINQNINVPFVDEKVHNPIMGDDFPRSIPLSTTKSSNIKIKTRKDMPNQSFIDKILRLLNHKSRYFYHLPFELEVLRKEQMFCFYSHY